jgi:hypothetical protein
MKAAIFVFGIILGGCLSTAYFFSSAHQHVRPRPNLFVGRYNDPEMDRSADIRKAAAKPYLRSTRTNQITNCT